LNAKNIGYLTGAGDEVAKSLEQIGAKVTYLSGRDLVTTDLSRFDAMITGVRAFNTIPELKFAQKKLFEYVNQGGTLLMQYNTSYGLVTEELAPYNLKLSRDRITVEEAPVKILDPGHPLMNTPNKITSADFENWVQERGLYFPGEWGEEFTPLLSSQDPGEKELQGGLLVARYGKGHYIYSSYSWFRQLPAGVPGAFRIFTNLLSIKD
jgi:hypothetical protein